MFNANCNQLKHNFSIPNPTKLNTTIRRKYIDKPGKAEKRPLGIPAIRDRIVQECMKLVLEPIFEAQFYAHSYGFRPMRDTAMALERAKLLSHHNGDHWVVEGDINKCFDHIDHAILLKRLYHIGVKGRRVLQIIKAMLKAGVMGECEVNEEGTPQGGIISPLLANVYLDIMMDEWVNKQWEGKQTRHQYRQQKNKIGSAVLKKISENGKVSGIQFQITGSDGSSVTKTTDANGNIDVEGMPIYAADGSKITYTATEINVPNRYVKPQSKTFQLTEGQTASIQFENKLKRWRVTVTKADSKTGTTPKATAPWRVQSTACIRVKLL